MNTHKILIVEDELIAAESLKIDLEKLGYEVMGIVTSGEKAINKVRQTNPDLILMDIMIKGEIDGIVTAEKIREKYHIPIIYLTAYADKNTVKRAESTQAYGYLVKPYKLIDISTTIQMAIAKYQEDIKLQEDLEQQKRLNTLKTHALATASHDLRNPLTNILGYTELLRDYGEKIPENKRKQFFNFIKEAVTEMNDSLEDLLLISQAEEGKLKLYLEEFDLVYLINSTVQEHCHISKKHQINFTSNKIKCLVSLDKKILRHAINNLLSNAIKYSPEGGDINVELKCNIKNIVLTIEDYGIGIPDEYKNKLFQLFERAKNVGSIKGNGLGLSIVKKAIELHRGTINLVSKKGKGAKFIINIPKSGGKTDDQNTCY